MLVQLVALVFNIYGFALFVYVMCSWVRHPVSRKIQDFLKPWFEPIFQRVRRVVKPIPAGKIKLDLAPMIVLIGIVIVRKMILAILLMPY